MSRHGRKVFAIAYRFTGRSDEAEDLSQEIFVKVCQALDRYQPSQGGFAAWLSALARNHAIDRYRSRRQERLRRVENERELDTARDPEEGPLARLERDERVQLVRRGLAALPPALREPIVMCDLRGMPYEEAAEAMGVPLGTLKSRLSRARLELARRLVGQHGGRP